MKILDVEIKEKMKGEELNNLFTSLNAELILDEASEKLYDYLCEKIFPYSMFDEISEYDIDVEKIKSFGFGVKNDNIDSIIHGIDLDGDNKTNKVPNDDSIIHGIDLDNNKDVAGNFNTFQDETDIDKRIAKIENRLREIEAEYTLEPSQGDISKDNEYNELLKDLEELKKKKTNKVPNEHDNKFKEYKQPTIEKTEVISAKKSKMSKWKKRIIIGACLVGAAVIAYHFAIPMIMAANSSLWHVAVGLPRVQGVLHGINTILGQGILGASFDAASGVWTLASGASNMLSSFVAMGAVGAGSKLVVNGVKKIKDKISNIVGKNNEVQNNNVENKKSKLGSYLKNKLGVGKSNRYQNNISDISERDGKKLINYVKEKTINGTDKLIEYMKNEKNSKDNEKTDGIKKEDNSFSFDSSKENEQNVVEFNLVDENKQGYSDRLITLLDEINNGIAEAKFNNEEVLFALNNIKDFDSEDLFILKEKCGVTELNEIERKLYKNTIEQNIRKIESELNEENNKGMVK